MSIHEFDESLGTIEQEPAGGVYTPALAKIQAGAADPGAEAAVAHRSATKQYMLLGGVILAGIGVLVFLRMQGVGAGLAVGDDGVSIDYPLDAPTNVNTENRQQEVLEALASTDDVVQVPADQIEENPFRLQSITSSGEEVVQAEVDLPHEPVGPREEELRLAELDSLVATLELNTVIAGRISLARINGKTYRIGDTVAGEFRVMAINPDRTVEIKADEVTYVLEMASR